MHPLDSFDVKKTRCDRCEEYKEKALSFIDQTGGKWCLDCISSNNSRFEHFPKKLILRPIEPVQGFQDMFIGIYDLNQY